MFWLPFTYANSIDVSYCDQLGPDHNKQMITKKFPFRSNRRD